MKPITFFLLIPIIFTATSCNKHHANPNPYDVARNTLAQNALLIQGHWIEDSVATDDGKIYDTDQPSYLDIDTGLNYDMRQILAANPVSNVDTGHFVFQDNRNMKAVSTGGDHYFSGYGGLTISVANAGSLILYNYTGIFIHYYWHYHRK